MGRVLKSLISAVLLCWLHVGGQAVERVALVIGNASYAQTTLVTPHEDAALMADALRDVGFSVVHLVDAGRPEMLGAIEDMSATLKDGRSVGFFYFSGIGLQVDGENFLLPVDALSTRREDLRSGAVALDRVLRVLDRGTEATSIVVIDAARDVSRSGDIRSLQRGLARVRAPAGIHIAFAAEPDTVAVDGGGENGAYAQALAKAIRKPGLELDQVFARARNEVYNATGRRQIPWNSSAAIGDFYFQQETTSQANPDPGPHATELAFWQSIQDSKDTSVLEHYLSTYPDGTFAELARLRLQMLRQSTRDGEVDPGNPPIGGEDLLGENERIARHPTVEAPDTVQVGARFPLQFWLTEQQLTPGVDVKPPRGGEVSDQGLAFDLPAADPDRPYWDIDVTLWAPGFDLGDGGGWNRSLRLYREGDTDPMQIMLVPQAGKTDRKLHFRLYHRGQYLGSAARRIQVRDAAAAMPAADAPAPKAQTLRQRSDQPADAATEVVLSGGDEVPDMQVVILYRHDADGVPASGHIDIISRLRPGHIVSEEFELNPGTKAFLDDTYARFVALGTGLRGAMSSDADDRPSAMDRSEAIHTARARGRELYNHHVPEAFKKYFWTLARTRPGQLQSIQITTNDSLIPWELVRPVSGDGEAEFDFLALEFNLARWALHEARGQRDVPPQLVRFDQLSTIAPTYSGREHLPFQQVEIDALSRIEGYRKVVGNFAAIEALMKEPINGIVHFTGHGEATASGTGRPAFSIRLEDERSLGSDTWLSLAQARQSDHPFYFFNACDTGRSNALGGFVQGWGPTLLASGASGFIGGLWPLLDRSAATFSADFYSRFSQQIERGDVHIASLLNTVRQRFLETGDPTYLAYTFYGDVNLRFYAAR